MKLLLDLRAEHELIESVVGSLAAFAAAPGEPRDGAGYARFFRLYADRYHHAREEGVLFPALGETEVPLDRGPIAVLLADHRQMRAMLDELAPLLESRPGTGDVQRLVELVTRYASALLEHIDAENTVLFPECEIRFRRTSTIGLARSDPNAEEAAARDEGARLVVKYPPIPIQGLHRGDGCVSCHAYGVTCDGIEREWWNDNEWEDALETMG